MILGFKVEDCEASKKYVNDVLLVNTNKQPDLSDVKSNVDIKWRQAQNMAFNPFLGCKMLSKKLDDGLLLYMLSLDFSFPDFGLLGVIMSLVGLGVAILFNSWIAIIPLGFGLFVVIFNKWFRSKGFLLWMISKALKKHKYGGVFEKVLSDDLVELFIFGRGGD